MEKAIKNKVAKAVVPAIDVMFQALRLANEWSGMDSFHNFFFFLPKSEDLCFLIPTIKSVNSGQRLCRQKEF